MFDYATETAFDVGKIEGKLEEKLNVAKYLKSIGTATEIISKATGLSENEINNI